MDNLLKSQTSTASPAEPGGLLLVASAGRSAAAHALGMTDCRVFCVAVALQAVDAAGGLFCALLCGGTRQGLDGVVGLGAGDYRGYDPGKDKGKQEGEPAYLGGG